MDSARWLLRKFHYALDRKLYGGRFLKMPDSARTLFEAFPEFASALHWHALFRIPQDVTERFNQTVEPMLKSVAKASSCDVRPIPSQHEKEQIVSYITKDVWKPGSIENHIVSSEFIRRRATFNHTADNLAR